MTTLKYKQQNAKGTRSSDNQSYDDRLICFTKEFLYSRRRKKVDDVYCNTISADFRRDPNGLAA